MPDTCGVCGEAVVIREVPGGSDWRHVTPSWHRPRLGTVMTEEAIASTFDSIRRRRAEIATAKLPASKPPVPAPLQRAVHTDDLPRSATLMRGAAVKAGWDVRATFSIGPWTTADGTASSRLAHCWVLRFTRTTYGIQMATACWVDGSDPLESPDFDGAYILTPILTSIGSLDLKHYLEDDVPCLTHSRLVTRLNRAKTDLHKLAKRASSGNPPKNLPEQITTAKEQIAELQRLIDAHGPDTCEICAAMQVRA